MRKASDILLIIGAVLGFIGAIFSAIGAIPMFMFTTPESKELIIKGINDGSINVSGIQGSAEEIAAWIQTVFMVLAIIMLVCAIPMIIGGVLALRARKTQSNGLYIAAMVVGIIFGGNIVTLIGSIFGLVENSNGNKNEVQQ